VHPCTARVSLSPAAVVVVTVPVRLPGDDRADHVLLEHVLLSQSPGSSSQRRRSTPAVPSPHAPPYIVAPKSPSPAAPQVRCRSPRLLLLLLLVWWWWWNVSPPFR
jgi:hypothetical protein